MVLSTSIHLYPQCLQEVSKEKTAGSGYMAQAQVMVTMGTKTKGQSYKICIMKTCRVVTRTELHIKQTPISTGQYLRDQLAENSDH